MKICLSCSTPILENGWKCPKCLWVPDEKGGVFHFAPNISGATESYDPAWYQELSTLELSNFWFKARNRLISWMGSRYLPSRANYLEVGCGTGFVLLMLSRTFPGWDISATEAQPEGIDFARKRLPSNITFYQMDACNIPFQNEFDVIGAFDVIEHIRQDTLAISQIKAALRPKGFFILSVPQHMFLWSKYDEIGCHFRRYSALELEHKLATAGFTIHISTSFNSLLLPLMLLSRMLKKGTTEEGLDVLAELRIPNTLNWLLTKILSLEYWLIRIGLRLPLGGSRIVIAQKID